jgi:VIT1/CCC1 family predicted Fe2+/Mn2+ transporter
MPGSALSLVVSTIAFFVASWFIKRWADDNDIPKGMTRNVSVFVLAAGVSYAVALLIDKLAAFFGG